MTLTSITGRTFQSSRKFNSKEWSVKRNRVGLFQPKITMNVVGEMKPIVSRNKFEWESISLTGIQTINTLLVEPDAGETEVNTFLLSDQMLILKSPIR